MVRLHNISRPIPTATEHRFMWGTKKGIVQENPTFYLMQLILKESNQHCLWDIQHTNSMSEYFRVIHHSLTLVTLANRITDLLWRAQL